MLECFTVKTHPILMKFKRRNVYLWIKVHKDLLLIASEILTAFFLFFFPFFFFFFFKRERTRVQGKERLRMVCLAVVRGLMLPEDRQRALGLLTMAESR